jgi:hypothetical protein
VVQAVEAGLPAGFDLDATARAHRALQRRRGVKSGADLLRLALVYAASEAPSLRATSAWAAADGVADLSSVALMKRLRGAADWLEAVLAALLQERAGIDGAAARPSLRLLDASVLGAPGRASAWRLHVAYDPAGAGRTVDAVLTGGAGRDSAERLGRFARPAEAVAIADRGYARAPDLVAAAAGRFIVRTGWNAARWRTPDGAPFDLLAALAAAPPDRASEFAVALASARGATAPLLPLRLIAVPLPPEAAERARRRAQAHARKQGRRIRPATLLAAGFLVLLSNLPADRVAAAEIAALYRLRWQVELAFKRLKSLHGLDRLAAKDGALARAWLAAKLIVALLAEDLSRHAAALFPSRPPRLALAP